MARTRTANWRKQAKELCERIANGETVTMVCKDLQIARSTPWRWAETDEDFRNAYARARESQAHAIAEQALVIAHGDDELTIEREEAIEKEANEMATASEANWKQKIRGLENSLIQRDKLRVDTLKWFASKLAPRLYGDKQTLEHTGKDGEPIKHEHKVIRWGTTEIPI